jgi:hypothetical protein
MNDSNPWLKTDKEKLQSLLADEAKSRPMLDSVDHTLKQLKAKSSFRIALINQLIEANQSKEIK